jgi:hypothetical protein
MALWVLPARHDVLARPLDRVSLLLLVLSSLASDPLVLNDLKSVRSPRRRFSKANRECDLCKRSVLGYR